MGCINEILSLMEKDGLDYNAATYTILIEWYSRSGKIEEAEKLFDEMLKKGIEPDVYLRFCGSLLQDSVDLKKVRKKRKKRNIINFEREELMVGFFSDITVLCHVVLAIWFSINI